MAEPPHTAGTGHCAPARRTGREHVPGRIVLNIARPASRLLSMATLLQDLRFGFRLLVGGNAGSPPIAALVLALGIGANTAVFSLVNALVLKPRPGAPDAELAGVYSRDRTQAGRLPRVLVSELRGSARADRSLPRRSPPTRSRWSASARATRRGACSWTSRPPTSSTRSACRCSTAATFSADEERPGADIAGRRS